MDVYLPVSLFPACPGALNKCGSCFPVHETAGQTTQFFCVCLQHRTLGAPLLAMACMIESATASPCGGCRWFGLRE